MFGHDARPQAIPDPNRPAVLGFATAPTLRPPSGGFLEVAIRIAVLASGSGTNLQALIDSPDLGAEIAVVLTDRPEAPALERARRAGIPSKVIPFSDYGSRELFSEAVGSEADEAGVEALVLAGFMRILAPELIVQYPDRILNIHPSLLPAFPGTHAVRQALDHGVKVTGVTVHFVDEQIDHGPIVAQRAVAVLPGDDEESLHARIQVEEHELYPAVVAALARGRLTVHEGKVTWA